METTQKTGRLLAVTILSGCLLVVLLCIALLVSGAMPKEMPFRHRDEHAVQQVQEESSPHRRDLVFEQVIDTPGTSGERSASLSELLPLVADMDSAGTDGSEFLCAYIQ